MLLGLSTSLEHKSPSEWATKMKEVGCGAVVFPVNYLAGEKTIYAYQQAAKDAGLVIAEVGIWKNALDVNQVERKKALEYSIEQLKMADEIDARCCVNVAGTPCGLRWDGGYRGNFYKETWDMTVAMIQEVLEKAKPQRTNFCIESMPWMIPSSPDEYVKLLNEVDHPRFKAHLDVVNMITDPRRFFFNDEFLQECFEKLKGNICSCHLKDIRLKEEYTFQLEETSCGNGNLDLELYAKLADEEDSMMPMIIEHLSSDESYLNSLQYVQKRLINMYKNGSKFL